MGGVCLQLAPQPFHRDGQGVFFHVLRPICPDSIQQLAAAQRLSPVFHQQTQQLLLGFGQLHGGAVPAKIHPVKIEGKWSQGYDPDVLLRLPAQLNRNPGPEDSQGKGLCDIVICAGFQPRHLVQFQIICSEQNHRRMVIPAAKAAQEIQPASVGEIDVQNQQIKPLIFQNLISLRKGRTAGDRPFRRFQRHGDSPAQYPIVFQKENVFHMVSSSANRMKPL